MSLRIGFDGSCLASKRGFGRFARWSLASLAEANASHEIVVFVDSPSLEFANVPRPAQFRVVQVPVSQAPSQAASARGRRRIADMTAMGRAVAREGLDLMFFPASYSFFPVWNVGKVVVAMHDALAVDFPELVFPTWRGRWLWLCKERLALAWADRIVTVSRASRQNLMRAFGLTADRIRIVPEGPEPLFRPLPRDWRSDDALRRWGLDPRRRFALYVGGLSPHKNLPRLIRAFARFAPDDARLVLVGDYNDVFHTHLPEIQETIAATGSNDRVILPGYVPDPDLVHLYNRASLLVQPSLMEGFGLPPVEAMACGVPIAASRAGSLPEVIGDAGLFFDPADIDVMGQTIRRLFDDHELRNRLAAHALQRARRFRRSATAQALLDCFEEIATPKRSAPTEAGPALPIPFAPSSSSSPRPFPPPPQAQSPPKTQPQPQPQPQPPFHPHPKSKPRGGRKRPGV